MYPYKDDLLTVSRRWRDLILASQDLRDYCMNRFQRGVRVFIGLNGTAPPKESDCPYVILLPREAELTRENYPNPMTLLVGWVVNARGETANASGGTELDVLDDANELGKMLFDAICEDTLVKHVSVKMLFEADLAELWPLFSSNLEFVVRYQ